METSFCIFHVSSGIEANKDVSGFTSPSNETNVSAFDHTDGRGTCSKAKVTLGVSGALFVLQILTLYTTALQFSVASTTYSSS